MRVSATHTDPDTAGERRVDWTDIAGARLGVAGAGLKGSGGDDLVVLHAPGMAAAVTTQSTAAAAPCRWTRDRVPGPIHAVVVNAGNANAATGPEGEQHTATMAKATAAALGCAVDQVLVCSTGVIGVPLSIAPVVDAIEGASRHLGAPMERAARAIMTTDTTTKTAGTHLAGISVGGFAKGSGMVHPDMATMLGFLATDVSAPPDALQALLEAVVDKTFNAITVDGDTSTNDTVILQATGRGRAVTPASPGWAALERALTTTCTDLARAIARDGEGATRLVEVRVDGLDDDARARCAARAVARSPLVKTAIHGCDPNWGRIVGALGAVGVRGLDALSLDLAGHPVLRDGRPIPFDEAAVSRAMSTDEVILQITLPGDGHGVGWGCDLTAGYVTINADYRT
ncbi:MAG: bifunctional glutamate N-acetyltransferase/amino-acid acetyltransferase ArgJ [Myxococcota bacterium]|nr:bifunctional glutamate N-acetyltransferase/amino-acid acetyltransferase ArgJ [Myxococcota bacterium]